MDSILSPGATRKSVPPLMCYIIAVTMTALGVAAHPPCGRASPIDVTLPCVDGTGSKTTKEINLPLLDCNPTADRVGTGISMTTTAHLPPGRISLINDTLAICYDTSLPMLSTVIQHLQLSRLFNQSYCQENAHSSDMDGTLEIANLLLLIHG